MLTGLPPEPPSYSLTMHNAPADFRAFLPPLQKFLRFPILASYLQLLVYRQVW